MRKSTVGATCFALAILAAAWAYGAWALARIFTGHCIDGPCERGSGERAYGIAQAVLAGVGAATCVAAVVTGVVYLATERGVERHLRLRVAAVAAFGLWLAFVIVGRLAGAH